MSHFNLESKMRIPFRDLAVGQHFKFSSVCGWDHECVKTSFKKYETVEEFEVYQTNGQVRLEKMKLQAGTVMVDVEPLQPGE